MKTRRLAILAANSARAQLRRLSLAFIRLATLRAPKGGISVQGEFYTGGQFIPNEVMERATPEERKAIEEAKSRDESTKTAKAQASFKPAKAVNQLATAKKYKAAGHEWTMKYDGRAESRGFYVRHKAPDGTVTAQAGRFRLPAQAAQDMISRAKIETAPATSAPPKSPRPPKAKNYTYAPDELGWKGKGKKGKLQDNLEALRVLRELQIEERSATEEEKAKLAKFIGWGQLPEVFNRYNYDFRKEREELVGLTTDEEFRAASNSTANSHFTHPDIVKIHWAMAKRLGYKGGNYLEPAVGAGYYLGFMPPELEAKSRITAIELDSTTGRIAKELYPGANVKVQGFQETPLPVNHFDLVATNVPFDNETKILSDPKFKRFRPTLHDYYFLKSVDVTKPGGLIMNITSAGTLDKLNPAVRNWLAQECELISAVRFPGGAHSENAGTQVVTDMIILRKKNKSIPPAPDETPKEAEPKQPGFTGTSVDSLGRLYHWRDGVRVPGPKWDERTTVKAADGTEHEINQYFADNPQQILGELSGTGSMYRPDAMDVEMTDDYIDRVQRAIQDLPAGVLQTTIEAEKEEREEKILVGTDEYNPGQMVVRDGQLYRYESGELVPQDANPIALKMIVIRDAARGLIRKRISGEDDAEQMAILNELYDDFVVQHGPLNSEDNRKSIKTDSDRAFTLALEKYNSTTNTAVKADMFSKNTVGKLELADKADSANDAVGISLHESGKVDLNRIGELLGMKGGPDAVEQRLSREGVAFRDPATGSMEHSAIYLSGDVRRKLREAKAAAEADPKYESNVQALEQSQPEDIAIEDISFKLGAPWIGQGIFEEFASETIGKRNAFKIRKIGKYRVGSKDEDKGEEGGYTESWEVYPTYAGRSVSEDEIWGVKGENGELLVGYARILESAMNGRPIKLYTEDSDGNRIPLIGATDEARTKVNELREQFVDWVLNHGTYRDQLFREYNDQFNNIVPTKYDGKYLTLPGMRTNGWPLRDFQKDFVQRVITTGVGLAAHEVGTGKTASMVAAAMELRRLGLAKKPAIACMKANIDQITAEAQQLYPNAKILSTSGMFSAEKRQQVLNQIATGDYDMVILTHDHLNMMRVKPNTRARFIEEELQELRDRKEAAEKAREGKVGNRIVKQLAKAESALEEKLKEALAEDTKDNIYFEDSGIDQLFVDEAHLFKSLPCVSANPGVKGVPTQRSQRATAMFARCRYLLEQNNGRGVVFATGTPIANTMAELFNMQRYLQYDKLKERGIHQFDAWADSFGDRTTNLEVKLSGEYQDTERFNKFTNLPELRHLASEFMDVVRADSTFEKNPDGSIKMGDGEPVPVVKRPKKFEKTIVSEPSDQIDSMMAGIHSRARQLAGSSRRKGKGEDNMLNVCNDAKKGSIDLRLLDAKSPDNPSSKANRAIAEIVRVYNDNPGTAQAVFSDLGVNPIKTPTGSFHLFGDMKKKLIKAGIPADQIVDFSKEMSDQKKEEVQNAIRRGDIRIAFGSTKRLGTGVNIQDQLKAVHHLDIPYVPADMEQREGRGWRSGNKQKEFETYRYVQQGSADDMFWTILANKKSFIDQYMLGKGNRTMADLDAGSLTPQEMIAVATGDTEMLERLTLENEVKAMGRAKMRHASTKARQRAIVSDMPAKIARSREAIVDQEAAMKAAQQAMAAEFSAMTSSWRNAEPIGREEYEQKLAKVREDKYSYENLGKVRGFEVEPAHGEAGVVKVTAPNGVEVRATATIKGIEYAIRSLAKGQQLAKAQAELEAAENDYRMLQSELGRSWGKDDELMQKINRLEALKQSRADFEASVRQPKRAEESRPEAEFTHTKLSLRM